MGERGYRRWRAYAQSKLANLLFARELDRRAAGTPLLAQSDAHGAWPSLYAATMPDVRGGDYWGPRLAELRGAPKRVTRTKAARDDMAARRLWQVSESLTGVTYALPV